MKKNILSRCNISILIVISIFISILLAGCIYAIKYNNCMDGSSSHTTFMEYVDGEIDFSNIRTFQARYCQDTKGLNIGWLFKRFIIYEIIMLGIILFIKPPLKKANTKWMYLSISILTAIIYFVSILTTSINDKSYSEAKKQCCVNNNGTWKNTYCEWENTIKREKNISQYDRCVNEAYKKYK